MKTYLCTSCWHEFYTTSILNRMTHDSESCYLEGKPDPRQELRKAREEICKLTNKPMCCQNTPCQCQKHCEPCLPPEPKHFVGDLILISGWKRLSRVGYDHHFLSSYESSYKWDEIKQAHQVVIAEAKYVDGEWRYFEEKGGICVVTDCHILKNYTRPEKQPKKPGRPKKSK